MNHKKLEEIQGLVKKLNQAAKDLESKTSLLHFDGPHRVYWIVTEGNDPAICDDGEFGVEIDGIPYLYYKYTAPSPAPTSVKYRRIEKREFGEVIRRPDHNS